MDKYTGKRLDARYEIHELIGVGGMALVYRAYDTLEEKIVAIKILKDEYLNNKEFIIRFKNESKAIAVLSHEHIVKVYDVNLGDVLQYIVMEYINGITLKEYISQNKTIKWEEAVYFVEQILKALSHAHGKGVIHRDIKTQNIMLLPDGNIKVTDFGIARFFKTETQTITNKAIGSVHYIAPEQARGDITDEKADIYSVGVILYELITGKLPFEADNAVSVAIMQMQIQPESPKKINDIIPEGLESITLHAMQKDAINRYNSADEMLSDILSLKQNPDVKFNYINYTDANSTKYITDLNSGVKKNKLIDKDNVKSKVLVIIGGIAVAVFIFAMIFLGISVFRYFNNNSLKDIEVPDFIGMRYSDLQNSDNYKFNFKVETVYDPSKEGGVVIDQEPTAFSKKLKENSTVILKINSPGVLVTIPSVKSLTKEVAEAKLNNSGIKYEVLAITDDDTPEGIVKSTDPIEGTKITADTTVRVYVSKGPAEQKISVPDVINRDFKTAKSEILSKNLRIYDSVAYEDSDKPKDTVLYTNPLPGVPVSAGSTVKLTLSSGRKKERSFEIKVDLPLLVDYEIPIAVYADGVLEISRKIIPAYNNGEFLISNIKGKTGIKKINVHLNNKQYRIYEIDFDKTSNNVSLISKYEFVPKEITNNGNKNNSSNNSTNTDSNTFSTGSNNNSTANTDNRSSSNNNNTPTPKTFTVPDFPQTKIEKKVIIPSGSSSGDET
ncbi:MAG: Ser/Thr-protein kinase PrkC [Candidatus Paraimprobicoccus trichonymphae]|uniref:non-specific serine/threonine protein kinase n=1 Tax=Candidatus Paraimprobicoccus trichonymphae TaxID=3033793 RepID=A0AA48KZI1_9FIRM|nr:MAG: Ser/Thr-protein kinase PrkC [Candidatus Paraimprobicoccus trichonymphae]